MPSKFNPKKFFKGAEVYGYGDKKFSYAVSGNGFITIRMLKDSKIRDAILKDITFAEFDEKMSKQRVKDAMVKVFDPDKEWIECKRLRLALQHSLDLLYLYAPVDGRPLLRAVQSHWVEALGDTIDWQVFMYGDGVRDPILFFGGGAEVMIMPVRIEAELSSAEVDMIEDGVKRIKDNLQNKA